MKRPIKKRHKGLINFRPDSETLAVLKRAEQEAGLDPSDACRIAIKYYLGNASSSELVAHGVDERKARIAARRLNLEAIT